MEGLSAVAKRAVAAAEQEARSLGHGHVGTEHLLVGLLANEQGTAAKVLREAGVSAGAVRRLVGEAPAARDAIDSLNLSARATRALVRARRFSHQTHAEEVGSVHVLRGIVDVEGTATLILRRINADVNRILNAVPEPDPVTPPTATLRPSGEARLACPSCGVELELVYAVVPAAGPNGDERDAAVFSCRSCGHVLGVTAARR